MVNCFITTDFTLKTTLMPKLMSNLIKKEITNIEREGKKVKLKTLRIKYTLIFGLIFLTGLYIQRRRLLQNVLCSFWAIKLRLCIIAVPV